jgi:hypothetical protein
LAVEAADAGGLGGRALCRVLATSAGVAGYAFRTAEVERLTGRWIEAARDCDDDYELAQALGLAAVTAHWPRADNSRASDLGDEAMRVARRLQNPTTLSYAAQCAGLARMTTDPDRALDLFVEGLAAAESVENQLGIGLNLQMQAVLYGEREEWREAAPLVARAVQGNHRAGDHLALEGCMVAAALILEAFSDDEAAATLFGTFSAATQRAYDSPWADRIVEAATALRRRLGDRQFDACVARGQTLDDDGLVALVVPKLQEVMSDAESPSPEPAGSGPSVLRRDGDVWLISYEGRSCRLRDAKGLHYLAVLLAQPSREVHVFDLVGTGVSATRTSEALDARAKSDYRRRLAELEAENAEATEWGDSERADRARLEAEAISAQLAAAYGLGGRPRSGAGPTERARKAVANRIRDSLARIDDAHPSLGRHLRNSVHTGTFCSYQPERPTLWNCSRPTAS